MFIIRLKKFEDRNFCWVGGFGFLGDNEMGLGWGKILMSHSQFDRVCVIFCWSCIVINSFCANV